MKEKKFLAFDCNACSDKYDVCTDEQINRCLNASYCSCGCGTFYYPYGPGKDRFCTTCGKYWPVWKRLGE
jgi:hypothetical protein